MNGKYLPSTDKLIQQLSVFLLGVLLLLLSSCEQPDTAQTLDSDWEARQYDLFDSAYGSVGAVSPLKLWLRSRSHVRLLRKHWPASRWPVLIPLQLGYLAGHAAWQLWHGRLGAAWAVWQGVLDELRDRPYAP